jgi:hypothetical protein
MFCPQCGKNIDRINNYCSSCGMSFEVFFENHPNGGQEKVDGSSKFDQRFVNIGLVLMVMSVMVSAWLVSFNPFMHAGFLLLIILGTYSAIIFSPASIIEKLARLFTNREIPDLNNVRKSLNAGASIMFIGTVLASLFASVFGAKNYLFSWIGPAEVVLTFFLFFVSFVILASLFGTKAFDLLYASRSEDQTDEVEPGSEKHFLASGEGAIRMLDQPLMGSDTETAQFFQKAGRTTAKLKVPVR